MVRRWWTPAYFSAATNSANLSGVSMAVGWLAVVQIAGNCLGSRNRRNLLALLRKREPHRDQTKNQILKTYWKIRTLTKDVSVMVSFAGLRPGSGSSSSFISQPVLIRNHRPPPHFIAWSKYHINRSATHHCTFLIKGIRWDIHF